ncbi:MAG: dockerin type I repeat-containing protein [Aeoliella sp.]
MMLVLFRVAATIALLLLPHSVRAAKLIEFDAFFLDPNGQPFEPQLWWGWNSQFLSAPGNAFTPVAADGATGMNAWQVSANAQSQLNPAYVYAPHPPALEQITEHGSRLSATARFVEQSGGQGGVGFGAFMNNRSYLVQFDLDTSGALRASLDGDPTSPHSLTPAGQGTADYHGIELRLAAGGDVTAEFWFDGQPILQSWLGSPLDHENTVQWGVAPLGHGTMNYNYVKYETGPFDLPGDFSGDGIVDAADYTLWRNHLGGQVTPFTGADADGNGLVDAHDYAHWKTNFGTPIANLHSHTNAVPEPTTVLLLLVATCAMAWLRQR